MKQTHTIESGNTLLLAPTTDPIDAVERAVVPAVSLREWNVLLVAYGHDHRRLRAAWHDRMDDSPAGFGAISVGEDTPPHRRASPVSRTGRDVTTVIRNPTDLVELGTTISLYLDDWTVGRTLVCFHSLDELSAHVDAETVFRFLHVLTRRLSEADAVGLFALDRTAVDERTARTLEPLFDAVREIESDEDPSLPPDVAFDVLGASRRRYVLHYLREHGDSTTVGELAEWVTRHEPGADSDRIEVSLHHSHLPKLENAGLISLGGARVTGRPAIETLAPYLELVSEHDRPE